MTTSNVEPRPYPLDNDHDQAYLHHAFLTELLDPISRMVISDAMNRARAGLSGADILEVGAGGGSMALWMAEQCGPGGEVTAIDLKPQHIPLHTRLSIHQVDLRNPEAIPIGPFDLIHARLTLNHLPNRYEILRGFVERLKHGGVVVFGDWRATIPNPVVRTPSEADAALYRAYAQAVREIFTAAGTDPEWAARAYLAMEDEGLEQVQTTVHAEYWRGGGTGCRLVANLIPQFRPQLLEHGLSVGDLHEVTRVLLDPDTVLHGHPLYYTVGQYVG